MGGGRERDKQKDKTETGRNRDREWREIEWKRKSERVRRVP